MKRIYYQKDKKKVVAIDIKKIATYSIFAKDYESAHKKLLKKHVTLSQEMDKRLGKIFSVKETKPKATQLNVCLVKFLKTNRVKILGIFAIMGMVNYFTLSWLKANISYLSHIEINHASLTDNFMNLPLMITIFCILFLLFLIPKKKRMLY